MATISLIISDVGDDIELRLVFDPPIQDPDDVEDTPAQNLAGWLIEQAVEKLGAKDDTLLQNL